MNTLIKVFPQTKNSCQSPNLKTFPTKYPKNQEYNKNGNPSFKGSHSQTEFGPIKFVSFKVIHGHLSFYFYYSTIFSERIEPVKIERQQKENRTEIGHSLEFDFVVPPLHSFNSLGDC